MRCCPLNRLETSLEEREGVHCWDPRELAAAPAVAVRGMRALIKRFNAALKVETKPPATILSVTAFVYLS